MRSMKSSLSLLAFTSMILALSACDGTTASGPGGGEGGSSTTSSSTGVTPHEPKVHRASGADCTGDRPPGMVDPSLGGDCKADADCMTGTNGRCVQALGKPAVCSYDECAKDADCGGASACECRNPAQYNASVCVHGNCVVDADCGQGGYCSPSAVTLDPFCTEGVPIGSVGYFCHAAEDECIDDDDCGGQDMRCFFNVDKVHFACFQLMCVL